jgi:ParB-like chromosome segregation protein Spo0J
VDDTFTVLGGNMRLRAAREAGLEQVPVYVVDWTEDQKREFLIKDNVSFGEWDWDLLANDWDAFDLQEWGLDVWAPDEEEKEEQDKPTCEQCGRQL